MGSYLWLDAQEKIEARRRDYNQFRPHGYLNYLTPEYVFENRLVNS